MWSFDLTPNLLQNACVLHSYVMLGKQIDFFPILILIISISGSGYSSEPESTSRSAYSKYAESRGHRSG